MKVGLSQVSQSTTANCDKCKNRGKQPFLWASVGAARVSVQPQNVLQTRSLPWVGGFVANVACVRANITLDLAPSFLWESGQFRRFPLRIFLYPTRASDICDNLATGQLPGVRIVRMKAKAPIRTDRRHEHQQDDQMTARLCDENPSRRSRR
jgi:hypothetical protein